jgi:hypothetical protein
VRGKCQIGSEQNVTKEFTVFAQMDRHDSIVDERERTEAKSQMEELELASSEVTGDGFGPECERKGNSSSPR